jgi:hypothetical protein
MATWLVEHLGPDYRNESLAGDLFEEYQWDRTRAWYWRQTFVAVCIGRAASVRKWLPQLAASALLRFLTEAAGLLGIMALSQQFRQACASEWMLDFASLVGLLAGIGLCVSLGFYISLALGSTFRSASGSRRSAPLKGLLSVFTVTALSAGTLTWAGAAPRTPQQCTVQGGSTQGSSLSIPGYAESEGQIGGR